MMENDTGEKQWGVWTFRTVLMLMVAVVVWYAQDVRRNQEKMAERQDRMAERLNTVDVDRATFSASRFTASDWVAAKSAIDAQINASERRIFKLESTAEQITKALDRIESRLGTSKDK